MHSEPGLPYLLILYSIIVTLTFEYIIKKKDISILISDKRKKSYVRVCACIKIGIKIYILMRKYTQRQKSNFSLQRLFVLSWTLFS